MHLGIKIKSKAGLVFSILFVVIGLGGVLLGYFWEKTAKSSIKQESVSLLREESPEEPFNPELKGILQNKTADPSANYNFLVDFPGARRIPRKRNRLF